MTGEPVPPARGPLDENRWDRPAPPVTAPLIQGLERLRERIRQRLDQIEALARERAAAPAQGSDQLDRDQEQDEELRQRRAELDEAQRRLKAEADRWEKERQAVAEQLEHDRRLLAEAWERLEREQVEGRAATTAAARPTPAARPVPTVVRAVVPDEHDDAVAQAILKQFQTLRRDVRRNAGEQYCLWDSAQPHFDRGSAFLNFIGKG